MILVMLGTHTQPMQRLVPVLERFPTEMSHLAPFEIQHGSTQLPAGWIGRALYPPADLARLVARADVVITHAGPASVELVRSFGKIPIVVPRQAWLHEHVDNHQVLYGQKLAAAREVLLVEDVLLLQAVVQNHARLVRELPAAAPHNALAAVGAFRQLVSRLMDSQ